LAAKDTVAGWALLAEHLDGVLAEVDGPGAGGGLGWAFDDAVPGGGAIADDGQPLLDGPGPGGAFLADRGDPSVAGAARGGLGRVAAPAGRFGAAEQGWPSIETPAGSTVAGSVTALREDARTDTGGDEQPANPDAAPDTGPRTETGTDAVPVLITPGNQQALDDQADATVKVSVVVGSTSDPVLVVPVAAVSTGADGRARVQVERTAGRTENVRVQVGLTALGYVQVSASGGDLAEGDRVVVGTR
jgi:hypothetical protein